MTASKAPVNKDFIFVGDIASLPVNRTKYVC